MVQVHVTPQITPLPAKTPLAGFVRHVRRARRRTRLAGKADRTALLSCRTLSEGGISDIRPSAFRCHRAGGFLAVKKLIALAVLGLGVFAVWRKVQSDRAELDLWTEATAADED